MHYIRYWHLYMSTSEFSRFLIEFVLKECIFYGQKEIVIVDGKNIHSANLCCKKVID